MEFVKLNSNPKSKKRGDCVVRAILGASGYSWNGVYKDLCEIGFEMKAMPNDKCVYEEFLKKIGFIKNKQPQKPNGKKYLVGEIDLLIGKSTAVISMANHLTFCSNKTIYDTWDCRNKTIGNYWIKNKEV